MPTEALSDARTPEIAIRAVSKWFGDHKVLNGVSTEVKKGEAVVVIGPSGSGKTTLLRCVNLLEQFQEGEITIGGQAMAYTIDGNGRRIRRTEREIAAMRAQVGMVFQSFNLFPHMSVLKNVALGPIRALGAQRKQAEELAKSLLARVGLADKADAAPNQLSGGQQQRVAIARALAMHPRAMLFDEVTSALDPELVGEVLDVMRRLV
ncbi:MAG: amino acid ABC transporter ATP-binding protein, partial [Terriglobia bacterium]